MVCPAARRSFPEITLDSFRKESRLGGMADEDWAALEAAAAKALSEALSARNRVRWAKATPAERERQGKLMRAGRRKKAKAKRGKR